MNNPIFNSAKIYLFNKYQIFDPTDLYKHLIQNPILCYRETLKKETQQDLLSKMIFLGGFHERRNCGPQAKHLAQQCLLQFREHIYDADVSTLIQIFLVMSNVLLYDETIVKNLLRQFKEKESQIQIKQLQSISHCLYKLGQQDEYWQTLAFQRMIEHVNQIGIQDYVQYMHIASNLSHLGQFQDENIFQLLDILKFKFEKQRKHIFLSKFSYQFVQLMFNLYPEIIKEQIWLCQSQQNNQFLNYFEKLKRDYIICRQILKRKKHGLTVDYFENDNFPNLIRLKDDLINRTQTQFEGYVENILKQLKLPYKEQERLSIYDVDFVVDSRFIINCNGPSHFIQTLEGETIGKSPNFMMQQRHLQEMGTHEIIDLDYTFWEKHDTKEQQFTELKRLLKL